MADRPVQWFARLLPPGRRRVLACGVVLFLAMLALRSELVRPLWYDEALTIMEFVGLDDPVAIYLNYSIPNNHIAYNLALLGWVRLTQAWLPIGDVSFRLFGLGLAVATLILMFWSWRRRVGSGVAMLVLGLLAVSPTFVLYAGAVRGYQLGWLAVLLAMVSGRRWRAGGSAWLGLGHFAAALLAVGVMPSNVLPLAAIALLPEGSLGRSECLRPRRLWLAFAPALALGLFYLPLAPKLMRALSLPEGWTDAGSAAAHLYGAFGLMFLPLLLLAIPALAGWLRARRRWAFALACLVLALPCLAILGRQPSPFPRVFYSFWPLWLFLLAMLLRFSQAVVRARWGRAWAQLLPGICLLPVLVWGWGIMATAGWWSVRLTPTGGQDDYFRPYFMTAAFRPHEAMERALVLSEGVPGSVFIDAGADPFAIIYYGKLRRGGGVSEDYWRFDHPGHRWTFANPPATLFLMVRHGDQARALAERFGLTACRQVADCGFHQIWLASVKP